LLRGRSRKDRARWRKKVTANRRYGGPTLPQVLTLGTHPQSITVEDRVEEKRVFSRSQSVIGSTDHGRLPFPVTGMANRPVRWNLSPFTGETRRTCGVYNERPEEGTEGGSARRLARDAQKHGAQAYSRGCRSRAPQKGGERVKRASVWTYHPAHTP
jgi:hypothetical protein